MSEDGSLTDQVPRPARVADPAGSSYARVHPLASPPAADPQADRMDWHAEVRPRADQAAEPGYLVVRMANSTHGLAAGDIASVPLELGRELVRSGYAWQVTAG